MASSSYIPSAFELENDDNHPISPLTTDDPPADSSSNNPPSALESTAPSHPNTYTSSTEVPVSGNSSLQPSSRSRKRPRRSSSVHEPTSAANTIRDTTGIGSDNKQSSRKRQRATVDHEPDDPSMRYNHHEHRTRSSTNGSVSQNGSSPHTNGSTAAKGAVEMETNGHYTNGHTETRPVAVPQNTSPFFGHDREEVTRILLQSLSDLGYNHAAEQLSAESGYELEIPSVAAFRSAVQHGEWDEAELLLFGSEEMDGGVMLGNGHTPSSGSAWRRSRLSFGSQNGFARHGLPLAEGADTTMLRFLLRQQKYLELLEERDLNAALSVLRNELTPLKRDIQRLHALSRYVQQNNPRRLYSLSPFIVYCV